MSDLCVGVWMYVGWGKTQVVPWLGYRHAPEGEEEEEGTGGRKPRKSVSSGQKRVGKERKTYA